MQLSKLGGAWAVEELSCCSKAYLVLQTEFEKWVCLMCTLLSPCLASCSYPSLAPPPRSPAASSSKCAVIFDAGSSGSRVHVYCFDSNMELIKFGDGYELFRKTSPGLSAYADTPEKGAGSLTPLLNEAIDAIPAGQRSDTPVRLGATAGLRLLPGDSAENLLKAVSINYLLGKIGRDYGRTVGTVDLGGGSVQMSYAVSDDTASNIPKAIKKKFVTELNLLSKQYHLYVHSYLGLGLLAGRAEILKLVNKSKTCACLAKGFQGKYVYDSVTYKAVGSVHGASFRKCEKLILKALGIKHSCDYLPCTFEGIWSGGGGDGQKNLYVASFFFDRAMEAGIILDPNATEATVRPADFGKLGRRVCKLGIDRIGERYPSLDEEDRPYFCLDIAYEYKLLVKGFGLDKYQDITLVKQIDYKNSAVEAQWALGSAIDVISSSS